MVHDELLVPLVRLGLCRSSDTPRFERLTGGVSSDIWRVDLEDRVICVKRALEKLRVQADWFAPVERNIYEAAWMRDVAAIMPDAVPALLGQDESSGLLAMDFLPPERFPLWKDLLSQGNAEPDIAAKVGKRLVTIHRKSAGDPSLGTRFPEEKIFFDIRLEPYLMATAAHHADCAEALHGLVEQTRTNRRTLVHGDVSPKNILIGPSGPVFLDAECACFGDPAFDLAFCLNHLLLKGLWVPSSKDDFLRCFDAMSAAYLEDVDWEAPAAFEARAAGLLPGLLLGRVDGKSPVEYLTKKRDKDKVREIARTFLKNRPRQLQTIAKAWHQHASVDDRQGRRPPA
ncbi:MAG: phosphotransferase family protein [Geminicoccales bacterium]